MAQGVCQLCGPLQAAWASQGTWDGKGNISGTVTLSLERPVGANGVSVRNVSVTSVSAAV